MYKILRESIHLLVILLLSVAPVFAVQLPKESAPTEELKARVVLYYGNLVKGEKTLALDLVAPESKKDFVSMNYDGLTEFRIREVLVSDAGDTAKVRLLRTDNFPGFPQLLDHETVDTWRRIDGQWYVLLPVMKEKEELDTPFGKLTFAKRSENKQQSAAPILQQGAQNTVSPEEAMRALQKARLEASKQKLGDQAPKAEDKKSEAQTAPKQNQQN